MSLYFGGLRDLANAAATNIAESDQICMQTNHFVQDLLDLHEARKSTLVSGLMAMGTSTEKTAGSCREVGIQQLLQTWKQQQRSPASSSRQKTAHKVCEKQR